MLYISVLGCVCFSHKLCVLVATFDASLRVWWGVLKLWDQALWYGVLAGVPGI